jgi:hypothetical protein
MENIIYLLCVEKERISGGLHYHPVIDLQDTNNPNIICCSSLIDLQHENKHIIDALYNDCEVTIIVPVDLQTYRELQDLLKTGIDNAQIALNNAYDALKKAYEILGKDISLEKSISDTTKNLLCKNMSFGKCLNEQLIICDCDVSYKEKYYEDFEEDIDYDENEFDEFDEYDE